MKMSFLFLYTFQLLFAQFTEFVPDTILYDQNGLKSGSNFTKPLAGNLNVVFIEYLFPSEPISIAQYTDRMNSNGHYYKQLGLLSNGISLQQYIENNGPMDVADFLAEAIENYFEDMSNNNITVDFQIPRNPAISSGIWYTANNIYPSTSQTVTHKSIMDSVYKYYSSIISNANCIVFFSQKANYSYTYSMYGDLKLSNGTVVYNGPYTFGRVFHWPQNHTTLAHEISHRIAKSVDPNAYSLTLPDRGTDRTVLLTRTGYNNITVNCLTGTYDLMFHNGNISTDSSLYGQLPLISYDLIRFGWIEGDEILEIHPNIVGNINNIKIADIRKALTSSQKSNGFHRIVKIYLTENYKDSLDEYLLIEYHKGTTYDKNYSNYDENIGNGLLVWQIAETSDDKNPAIDLLTAVPYNGYYGSPLPNDSYPKTWEIFNYPSNWSGIAKNKEYDWLNDHLTPGRSAFGNFDYAPNGGRHIYEALNTDNANWYRMNSKNDDFFTNVRIKGRINNKILPTTRPSTRNWWGEHTNIGIINIMHENDYMKFDFYNNYWSGTITQDMSISDTIFIYNELKISNNSTLTINPGTVIYLNNNSNITVEDGSKLIADGTSDNHITFKKSGSSSWYKIYLKGDNNVFDYCDFNGGKYSLKFYYSSGNSITNCSFNNSYYAIIGSHSDFTADNCDIQNASTRGVYCTYGKPVVKNSKIHNCTYGIKYYYTSGTCKIENNEIYDTQYDGLIISHTSPSIKNNYIHNTGGKGVNFSASNSRLEHNTINYCNIGIYGSNNSNFSMEDEGYNKIIMSSSSSSSVIKIAGGTPNIGEAPHDEGENDIRRGTGYSVENLTSSEIFAEKNY